MGDRAIGEMGDCNASDEDEDPPAVAQATIGVEENRFQVCILA
jgi:hypothetical protein